METYYNSYWSGKNKCSFFSQQNIGKQQRSMSDQATQFKNEGNEALKNKDYDKAIECYTKAIELEPSNHVFYSNRSVAFTSINDYNKALEDANKVIELKADWPKGYSRKGDALLSLGRAEEAVEAYTKYLELDPNNEQVKADLNAAKRQATQKKGGVNMNDLFNTQNIMNKIATNPKLAKYLGQPDFMQMVQDLQSNNPQKMQQYSNDPRFLELLGALLGVNLDQAGGEGPMDIDKEQFEREQRELAEREERERAERAKKKAEEEAAAKAAAEAAAKAEEANRDPKKTEALAEKEKGNACYNKKDFDAALQHYNKSIELDPENMVYLLNRAAVYFAQGKFQDCIAECEEACKVGRSHGAHFEQIAKAYTRIGNAYMKMEDYNNAIIAYKESLTEHRNADTLKRLADAEKAQKLKAEREYLNPEISLQEKEKGNDCFRNGQFPEAIKHFTEAIKRNPTDHTLYSNRAASYMKLGEYMYAKKDCEKCIELKPDFVKAYLRLGNCHYFMKEYHKALEFLDKGLKLDPENQEITEAVQRTVMAINSSAGGDKVDEERVQRAMADPEIQAIMTDPVMQQVLKDIQENPSAGQKHLRNPMIMSKIEKLIAAGVLRMG